MQRVKTYSRVGNASSVERLSRRIEHQNQIGVYKRKKVAIFDYVCGDVYIERSLIVWQNLYIAGDIPGNTIADVVLDPNVRVHCQDEAFDIILYSSL